MIVTIDMICLKLGEKGLEVLLIKRTNPERPQHGMWSIPGGFVFEHDLSQEGGQPADADFDSARRRICRQKIHTYPHYISEPMVDGNPKRDPHGWSVTIAHYALLNQTNIEQIQNCGLCDQQLAWFALDSVLQREVALAFDHADLIRLAWTKLRAAIEYTSVVLFALEKEFLVSDIIHAYAKFGVDVNRMTIKRRLIDTGVIVSANKIASTNKGKGGKPAQVYSLADKHVTYFQTCLR
ncbi:NUDIX hydrolase [Vibrio vulnificus]|uniref:NUDIX hydrolase n=1 Tax=Vibrio vulnificus TaxID=672 RepID=UPI0015937070|nr:NUDIX hydrolase [Vibrio vulnificus]EHU4944798.1 NUDIX hydrolase [Vibrio vulnificus]EJV9310053.1 NUDIX hydrolase [Vibrio vulnificus]ELA3111946.1 NUDIX hydrolase [Vibrio vulnificus]ELB7528215.1 NUDIX hydrolase [Vibrio vulnificus]ELK2276526.1 NUDIX hydrolase [Vibrio vulnificus]